MKIKTVVPINSADARRAVARFGKSPRTSAVPVLPLDAYGTEEWRTARLTMIGASEMAAVVGLSPWASPFSLWWSKQDGWQLDQTLSMRLGHELEPIIARLFAETRPDLLVCRANASLWRSPVVEWMGATPDYLAVRNRVDECTHGGDCVVHPTVNSQHNLDDAPIVVVEPVECKSDEGGKGWGRPGTDEVPDHHRVQVLQQCAVFGAPRGHLVRMAGKRFSAYVVEYDDAAQADIADWVAAGHAFVASLVAGVAPELDDHAATTDALVKLYPAVDEDADATVPDDVAALYEVTRDTLASAKAEYVGAQNAVRGHLQEHRFGVVASTGRRFVDRRVFKRREYSVPSTVVDALYPVARNHGPRHARVDIPAPEPGAPVDTTAGTPDQALDVEGGG